MKFPPYTCAELDALDAETIPAELETLESLPRWTSAEMSACCKAWRRQSKAPRKKLACQD